MDAGAPHLTIKRMKSLILPILMVHAVGTSDESDFTGPRVVLGGLDIGAHEINNRRNASVAFNGGLEGPMEIYLGGQFACNREWMLPPYWNGKPDPIEYEFEINGLIGRLFSFQDSYLRACLGLGFAHGVRRGAYIPDSENKNEKESLNGVGLPLELSAGFLRNIGIGLKWKAWVGRNPYSGIMVEFLGRRER
jgi:hypothetical protein